MQPTRSSPETQPPQSPRPQPARQTGFQRGLAVAIAMLGLVVPNAAITAETTRPGPAPSEIFIALAEENPQIFEVARRLVFDRWHPTSLAMVTEVIRFTGRYKEIARELDRVTGQSFGGDYNAMLEYQWSLPPAPHPEYAQFKKDLYSPIDPRFAAYFEGAEKGATIRLDEIRWGGVKRDGIPPLDHPKMISAPEASYLGDSDIIFGIEVDGEARAYPKRILAWHEMFRDTIGARSLNGVYCTLCGSMILYETDQNGVHHELGTSGFLYRSNKLMYDQATESLWSTLTGEPVVGPLVGKGIRLKPRSVVTTTWREWKERHPDTEVLSLDTGHVRDYSEGAAYRDYFATDALMFTVPDRDTRLKNKADVLGLRFGLGGTPPTAISSRWLRAQPIYHNTLGGQRYVVLTDPSGAHRVYASDGITFDSYNGGEILIDDQQHPWIVEESQLKGPAGQVLNRLPAHRAFWFGWHAAFPETELIGAAPAAPS